MLIGWNSSQILMLLVCKHSNTIVMHLWHFSEKLWNVWLLSSLFPYNFHSRSLTFSRNKSYGAKHQRKVCISRRQPRDQWVVKNLFPCCCQFFRFTQGYSCWRRDVSVCTQLSLRHNIWGWKHRLSSTAAFSHFQREMMPKQAIFHCLTFSHLSFVNDWTEIIMVHTALKWESEVHWLHLDGQQRRLPLSAGFTPWLTPIGVKKKNE